MDRFTQLPPFPGDESQPTSISWHLNGPVLPVDVSVLSWAALLHSFTKNETPVFTLNGLPVKADLSTSKVHAVALDTGLDVSESYTAVVIENAPEALSQISPTSQEQPQFSGLRALSLNLDSQTGVGALHSPIGIDAAFLQQIGKELKQFIYRQATLNGLQMELPSTEVPELSISNPAPWTLPGPGLLHELALHERGKSDDNALEFLAAGGTVRSLTYRSMDELSTKLAAHITIALGPPQVDPTQSVVIPVLLPQSIDFYITCIAILKAGAAFCPLNTDTPPDRIEFILQDVAAPIVVTQRLLATKVPNDDGRLILITTDELETQHQPDPLPSTRESNPLSLAYVMYTSGSTGRPKGVGISHLAVTQSLLAHDELIPPFTRFLQFASPTFDVSVFEYFFPLMRGATIIGCDRETMVRDISHVLRRMNVDGAELTPTVAGELLRKRTAAPSLRVLLTIGEMLTRRVVDEFAQSATSDGILHGMYGPTEAAIHCTAAPAFQTKSRVNLIGQPLKTVSAFVISFQPEDNVPGQELCILPFGQIGELVVGGSQLADGYINRPEENAKAFIESPSYGRLYRTGDKARMLPNGELECFGRIASGQVKLRGQRIELGEIEHAVCMTPNVRSAVAIVASGTLVAFVVTNDKETTDDELRQACRRWLPRFMVPGEFVLVDSFPTLPSGKIDRKLLEFEYLQQRQSAQGNVVQALRDTIEETIASCVTKTLMTSVPATDSLAAAGLDSLAAIRLASHLRDAGLNFEVGKILEADSIDGIWNLAKTIKPSHPSQGLQRHLQSIWQPVVSASVARLGDIGIEHDIDDVEPCSHIQQAMIAETVRNPMAYCNWIELEFYPPMDFTTIRKTFCKVAQHNDLLRSGFLEIGIKDHSYSRFAWKELKGQIFQETQDLTYDLSLGDEYGILYPMRIQYKHGEEKIHVLVHIHHALYDGWSWKLVLEDLQNVLAEQSLPQRPPYKEVTCFLTESKLLGSMSESSTYWQDQLYGMSPASWPNLNPRTDIAGGREQVTRMLGVSTSNLNEVSRHLRISRQAIFQAAFSYLLSIYLGTSDVVFGTVFSGRTLPIPGIESIIGPCIRVLPTRMNLNKVQNVADLLLAINNTNRKSLEHGILPLQDIKKASGIDLNLSLFDSAIVWQETIWSGEQRNMPFKEVAAADFLEFAMLLELEPKNDTVEAKVTYQKSVLPSAQMEIFLEQLDHVTSVLLASPDLPTSGILDHLPPSTLSIENQHFEPQINLPSLASGVEDVASTDPGRAAIEFLHSQDAESGSMRTETVTYKQLNVKANRLARHLVHLGVQKGDFVGILLDKSIELYVSILAVLKIGAGYVPLRPDMPSQRVHYILTESQPRVCITSSLAEQEHELGTLEFLRSVDVLNSFPEGYPESNLSTVIDGSNVSYAIFTSGSTGTPKGVLVTHHNMQSNIAVLSELYPIQNGSKMLQACSHSFDVSVFEILFTWQMGMTLCATTNDILFRDIQNVIRGLGITHLSLTPTVAGLISAKEVPDVQFLVTSGEGLTAKVHQDWTGRGLHQGYGPCETTNICTVSCDTGMSTPLRNIGPPLKNTSVFVMLNEDDCRLSPRGAVGEFCFGGDQVARGYLNRPDLTAAKFIDHPQYGRIYRSGDYGRLLVDGSLCYVGRRDDQVKLRGQRIELREINSVLLQTGIVHDCASMIMETGARKQQLLLTFWVRASSAVADAQQLVRALFEKLARALPAYMVPSMLIPVGTIPMTENGKTDQRLLQRQFQELSLDEKQNYSLDLGDADDDGDLSELEGMVVTALSEVTGVDIGDISRHTSFYNMGLDSISAISFSKRLRDSGLGQLDVSTILRHSSVARLSTIISSGFDERVPDDFYPSGLGVFNDKFVSHVLEEFRGFGKSVQSIYPCTPLQEAMLSAEASKTDSAYFNHLLFQLNGDLDLYRQTWELMLRRHAILRTFFKSTNDAQYVYAQVVVENVSLPWLSVEASANDLSCAVEKRKLQFEEQFQATDVLPYSLTVFKNNGAGKSFLLLSMHHALYDGEAMVQLLHEIQLSLSNQLLPEVVQFEHFIGHVLRMDVDRSDKYWDEYLSDVSPSLLGSLKIDKETTSGSSSHESRIELELSYDAFKNMCKEASVTPLNLFHAAWARLLSIYTESSDVCFGNVFSCRTIPLEGADRVVGPCFNTLPTRIKIPSAATNQDIMKAAQINNSNTLPYQLSSLRRIQRRNLGDGSPLFDTLVILQTKSPELDRNLWELISEKGSMDFPFICEITPDEKTNNIHIYLYSKESCISAEDVGLVVQQFAALIDHTIRYPSAQALDKRPIGEKMPSLPRKITGRSRKLESLAPVGPQTSHPWTSYEEEVQDILCKFSKADKATVLQGTTIFQLGLDSINAVQISACLGERGYSVSAGSILEAATISEIATLLSRGSQHIPDVSFDFASFEAQHLQSTCGQLQISQDTVESLRPCTPAQNGILAVFSNSNGDVYFNQMTLKAPTSLDKALLKDAWIKVMRKHEMLRTGFVQLKDQEYPFAMITYREGVASLPWDEVVDPTLRSVPSQTSKVLESLHQPPWFLAVESSDTTTTMQFSALHAIYDAQSLHLIFADVAAAYRGETLGNATSINSTLGPILTETTSRSDKSREFWTNIGKEVQPVKFPDLHPFRVKEKELLTSCLSCSTPRQDLEDGCQKLGMTLQAAGQAAWARLLSAYTGEPKVTFGVVLSGRNLSAAAQEAAFPCLVTVPSPCRVGGTNREVLSSILKRNASLMKYQFTPLSKIQRWLKSDEGLFDTLFVYQKFASQKQDAEEWDVVDEDARIDYPVSIELVPRHGELEFRLTHRGDVVPQEQAMTILEQFDRLLTNSIFSPDSNSDNYSFLGNSLTSVTPAEQNLIPSPVSLLHQFVEKNAEKIPSKLAFEFVSKISDDDLHKKTWTYREFNDDGNKIARLLQEKGTIPGSLIAICFDKCPEASLGILGVLKAGCAYVTLDPNAPLARKQFILEDSASNVLLCTSAGKPELEKLSGVGLIVLDSPGVLDGISSEAPTLARPTRPDDTCYCLYTSGTTGTPKGCEITHENAVQAMLAFQKLFEPHWDEESRWLQFASFHFDVSVLEQYWSWSVGICVTSCPRDLLFEDLPGTIRRLQITHIDLTPSLARLVLPEDVPSLCRGVFITGGEQLKQEILDAWGHHGVIYNGYGPTEVTIGCTMLPRVPANGRPSNIGPQFVNVGSYVMAPGTTTPVIRGGIGELCVSGALVGRGYLNRPELTEERFQYLEEQGERIYRTGDLVRILHDGSFQFLGRIDDQVKLRGQRLEIGEINEVIRHATPELNEVTTLVIKHPKQSKEQLVSFVTKKVTGQKPRSVEVCFSEDNGAFLSGIKSACQERLPGYMVPTHIIPMTLLPLSANNKVDAKVLKSIYGELSLEDIQKLTSMSVKKSDNSDEQRRIISLLSKFLGSPESEVSPWSSIYELGLDSISVISFSRLLRDAGFKQAQPSLIMKNPTISGMAATLRESAPSDARMNLYKNARQNMEAFAHRHSHSILEDIGVSHKDVESIAPCTPLQEGIIYHFLNSGKALYCSSFNFELDRSVSLSRLESAWLQTKDEVQILRTRLSPTPDGYAQVILKDRPLALSWILVSSEMEIEEVQKSKFKTWVDGLGELSRNLWEVSLVQSPSKSVMCLNIFHALYDGNSLSLLLEMVARKYLKEDYAAETSSSFLDTLPVGPLCKDPSAQKFWTEHLKYSPGKLLPKSDTPEHSSVVKKVDIDVTEHVDQVKKSLNVTEQAVLHACWLLTLHHQFGFVPPLGIVVSGRALEIPDIESVIGPLFNTIPSNVNFRGLKTWSDIVQRCHDYHSSSLTFQHTPLRDIMKWVRRTPSEPLFDSLFVFQRGDSDGELANDRLWKPVDSEAEHEYPLAFEVTRNGNKSMTLTLAAQDHMMSSETAQDILSSFEQHIYTLSQNPATQLLQKDEGLTNGVGHVDGEDVEKGTQHDVPRMNGRIAFQWTAQADSIRNAIADLAGVERESVSADTSIFELGLDSIDAIKLSSRLSKLGIRLAVSVIMRWRTIREMTQQLTSSLDTGLDNQHASFGKLESSLTKFLESESQVPAGTCRVLPATPIQEAMVAEMVASDYTHYYNHDFLELEPNVDISRLRDAWQAVVKANPILRTSFVEVWDPKIPVSYAQIVHDQDTMDFRIVKLQGKSIYTIIEYQRSRAASDSFNRPLLTVTVAVDGDKRYLVLSMAHSLYDGWSINLLHEDVARYYAGDEYQRPRYDDILENIIASSGDSASKFWRTMLENSVSTTFPKGQHAGGDLQVVHRREKVLSVSGSKVDEFCKSLGITMQALSVSCWALVLAGFVEKLDVVFGLVLSGRNMVDSESVMFPTMNTVAMRTILHGSRMEMVRYVQDTLVDMSEHQHFPLRKARSDIGTRQLFDTLFIYQKRPGDANSQYPTLYNSTGGSSAVDYPVCVEMENEAESVVCRVACQNSVMGVSDTNVLLGRIEQVLQLIIQEPDEPTIEFIGGGMRICESQVFQDSSSSNGEVEVYNKPSQPRATEWSDLEVQIREVLSIVSGIAEDQIDKKVTLFQLGLDSISAIKVALLLKKRTIRITVSDLLKAGDIEQMAQVVNQKHVELTSNDLLAARDRSLEGIDTDALLRSNGIQRDQLEKVFPVTAGQLYFLAMNALNPESFYPSFYYLSNRELSQDVVNNAWARVTSQLPMLRTAFMRSGHRHIPYVQAVMKTVHNPVIWHTELQQRGAWGNSRKSVNEVPVTLHACQTVKGTLVALHIHHALYDAVSLPRIIDILAAFCNGQDASAMAMDADLLRFVAYQHINSPADARKRFWESYLGKNDEGVSISAQDTSFGRIESYYRPGLIANMSKLEKLAKHASLSIQSIILAVYARVHGRTVDQSEGRQVIGLYLANRSHGMEGLIDFAAPTLNIVPLRIDDKHGEVSLLAAARTIQDELNEIGRVEHACVSLQEIAEWTGVRLDTCFNFMRFPEMADNHHVDANGSCATQFAPVDARDLEELAGPSINGSATVDQTTPNEVHMNGVRANIDEFQDIFKVREFRHPMQQKLGGTIKANGAYPMQPTLDMEAAIRNDRLDFGVFGPKDRVGDSLGEGVVEDLRREMVALMSEV